jgi:uroporphyrinogen III methyltransferase/synthase
VNGALAGCGVAVTRNEPADGPLSRRLSERGATVFRWPTLVVRPVADAAPLERALERLSQYDWILFSSRNAVAAVTERVARCPEGVQTAVVGESTAEALEAAGWPVHLVPRQFSAAGLVEELTRRHELSGRRVLFPAGSIARETIPQELGRLGAQVDRVTAYETRKSPLDGAACVERIEAGAVQAVTFASPSAVEGFRDALGERCASALADVAVVAIGPTTGAAVEELCEVQPAVAEPSTIEGLAAAVVVALQQRST